MWRLVAGGIPTSATVSINKLYPEVLSQITRRLYFVLAVADINEDQQSILVWWKVQGAWHLLAFSLDLLL